MTIGQFPSLDLADESGLLAIGGDLEVSSLLLAYSQGIFPWPYSDFHPLAWYSPNPRGVLFFKDFVINRTLQKFLKKNPFTVHFNRNFKKVIELCAQSQNRKGQHGTWITQKMKSAYIELHHQGYAFSVEVYENKNLVGGLYGVCIDHFISGESMFYLKSNASKLAIWALIEKLSLHNIEWMDIQMVTPLLKDLGGMEIPRAQYLSMLAQSYPSHHSGHTNQDPPPGQCLFS